jgi:hypothetical protein
MELTVIGAVVAFLLLFLLAIQIQISGLSVNSQETIKKVDKLIAVQKKHEEAMTELYIMHREGKGFPQKDNEGTKDIIWHG